jgi:hypothetical protein
MSTGHGRGVRATAYDSRWRMAYATSRDREGAVEGACCLGAPADRSLTVAARFGRIFRSDAVALGRGVRSQKMKTEPLQPLIPDACSLGLFPRPRSIGNQNELTIYDNLWRSCTGRCTTNWLPLPRPSLCASILPPWSSTRFLASVSPIHSPPCERWKE